MEEEYGKAEFLPKREVKREQCIKACIGCNKMYSGHNIGDVCIAYVDPKKAHRLGVCALKSNKVELVEGKKKTNPLKASKRSRRRGIR